MRALILAWASVICASLATQIAVVAVAGEYPGPSTTGVPAGVPLSPHSGTLIVNTPGAVISGLDIRGSVAIKAANVTLKNCRITCMPSEKVAAVHITASGATVQDCEIDGAGAEGVKGILGYGTFLRNNIHHTEDGIFVSQSGAVIEDNYIHDLQSNWPGPHYDGIQIEGGISDVVIRGNTIINPHSQTSAVMIDNNWGPISNIIVDNNVLVGGGYTIYVDAQFNSHPITGVKITNNRLGRGRAGYINANRSAPEVAGNVDHATGRPIPGPQAGGRPRER
jgi:hypothetical protein